MFTIRQENKTDWSAISEVIETAFEPMELSDHREQFLVERLRKSEFTIPELSLVAENKEGDIIGHIMLTKVRIETPTGEEESLALAPLSVSPAFQRQGVGTSLILEAESIARNIGFKSIAILGDPEYYGRFGYKPATSKGIKFALDAPSEYCLIKELITDGIKEKGTLIYPDLFFQ